MPHESAAGAINSLALFSSGAGEHNNTSYSAVTNGYPVLAQLDLEATHVFLSPNIAEPGDPLVKRDTSVTQLENQSFVQGSGSLSAYFDIDAYWIFPGVFLLSMSDSVEGKRLVVFGKQ